MHRLLIAGFLALAAAPAAAQVLDPADRSAASVGGREAWYQLREPIQYAGELYYPAGAAIFFNGNSMVRTGHYNGVPLYADATRDPYSVVYVPIGRGQLQPYERLRRGDLAGTTGSLAAVVPGRRCGPTARSCRWPLARPPTCRYRSGPSARSRPK